MRRVFRGPEMLIRYQFGNHLGSVSLELDDEAMLISFEEYYPFGSTSCQAVRSQTETRKQNRYMGKERDEESGFYYHGARYYVAWLTRWVSIDPLLDPRKQETPYAGFGNNPVRFVDADGRQLTAWERHLNRELSTPEGSQRVQRSVAQVLGQPRVVGTLQTVGGVLEMAGGVGLLAVPEPTLATKVGGVALFTHGGDTTLTGLQTLWTGQVQHTLTQRVGENAAEGLGADPETARWVGTGVDFVAGVGPSVAVSASRRFALVGAEKSTERVTLAYIPRGSSELGHNAVGITVGGQTRWFDLRRTGDAAKFRELGGRITEGGITELPQTEQLVVSLLEKQGAKFTSIAVSASRSSAGLRTAEGLVANFHGTWGLLGPNCSTTVLDVLQSAGVAVPAGFGRTPLLLHVGVNYGYEITAFTSVLATTSPLLNEQPTLPANEPTVLGDVGEIPWRGPIKFDDSLWR
jgi:RHS repeat-associated protein